MGRVTGTNKFSSGRFGVGGGDDNSLVAAVDLGADGTKDDYTHIKTDLDVSDHTYVVGRGVCITVIDASGSGLSVDATITGTGVNGATITETLTGLTGVAGAGTVHFFTKPFATVTDLSTETTGYAAGDSIELGEAGYIVKPDIKHPRAWYFRNEAGGTNAVNIAFGRAATYSGNADNGNHLDQISLEPGNNRSLDDISPSEGGFIGVVTDVAEAADTTATFLFEVIGFDY